jgi:hypothetical protein
MNNKVLLLFVGLVVGGAAGWFTRPATLEIDLGRVNIAIQDTQPAADNGSGLSSEQLQHIGIFMAIGSVIGLALGFAVDAGRRT